jgi:predicted RNA binding protein YcfA (HicA-like mRNA interferase family)
LRVARNGFQLYTNYTIKGARLDSREILRILKTNGWTVLRQAGSHVQLKHPHVPGKVTVPHPKRDLPIGTVKSIERQSRLRLK